MRRGMKTGLQQWSSMAQSSYIRLVTQTILVSRVNLLLDFTGSVSSKTNIEHCQPCPQRRFLLLTHFFYLMLHESMAIVV